MKKLLFLSAMALTLCGAASAQTAQSPTSYGTAFSLQEVSSSPGRLPRLREGKQKLENAKMMGVISQVCQAEACWLMLKTDYNTDDAVLIKMKDHAFVVPKNLAGKRAAVSGTIVKKMQSVEEQKHLLQDAGASAADIAKVSAPKEMYEMQATGVVLYN